MVYRDRIDVLRNSLHILRKKQCRDLARYNTCFRTVPSALVYSVFGISALTFITSGFFLAVVFPEKVLSDEKSKVKNSKSDASHD